MKRFTAWRSSLATRSHGRPDDDVRAALPWILATLLTAFVPALWHLPPWMLPLALLPLGLKAWAWRSGQAVGPWWWGSLLALSILALAMTHRQLGAGNSVLAAFVLVLAVKALETQRRRDALLLVFGACVLAALAMVHYPDAIALLLLLLLAPALLAALAALAGTPRPLRTGSPLLGLALPPALLLFLLVPRIPGPLWDFGLALGLPIGISLDRGTGGRGAEGVFTPGAPRGSGGGDGTALVAEFDGYVPPVSRLYWRGPVLWRFDGRDWHAAEGFERRAQVMATTFRSREQWEAEWRSPGRLLSYRMRLAPHGQKWLYALDLPAEPVAESFLTRDYQLLSMSAIIDETRYQATAWLDGRIGREPDPARLEAALQLPSGRNPRLVELGRRIAAEHPLPRERAVAALEHFGKGGYRYDEKVGAPQTEHPYDAFLFDTREGGSDLLAASFVLLMRAAGVPARLVAGYRGGRLMALTDFVLVKESNAHAWSEVWLADEGWMRLDPTDFVAPQRFADGKPATARKPAAQTPAATAGAGAPAVVTAAPVVQAGPAPSAADASQRSWLAMLDKWVIRYDARRQSELFGDGESVSGGWAMLSAALAGILLLLAGLYAAFARWTAWRRADPVQRGWERILRQLARGGLEVAPCECPHALSRRLAGHPRGTHAAELAATYARLRYGRPAAGEAAAFARACYHFRFFADGER